jgi:hypothetical protein
MTVRVSSSSVSFPSGGTNAAQVHKLLQPDQQVYEVIGKPYDVDIIVQAVKEAARSRPTH